MIIVVCRLLDQASILYVLRMRTSRLGAFAGTVTSASDAPGCMAHFDKQEYYFNNHVTGHVRVNEFKICVTSQEATKTKAPTTKKPTTKAPTTKAPTPTTKAPTIGAIF